MDAEQLRRAVESPWCPKCGLPCDGRICHASCHVDPRPPFRDRFPDLWPTGLEWHPHMGWLLDGESIGTAHADDLIQAPIARSLARAKCQDEEDELFRWTDLVEAQASANPTLALIALGAAMTDADVIAERLAKKMREQFPPSTHLPAWWDLRDILLSAGLREAVERCESVGVGMPCYPLASGVLAALKGQPSDLERGLIDGLTKIRDALKPDQPQDTLMDLDPGIRRFVETLCAAGIETFESCQGGAGHAYPEPTIRFHGDRSEGFRALAVAQQHDLPVATLRRIWPIVEDEPTGPWWEMTFVPPDAQEQSDAP